MPGRIDKEGISQFRKSDQRPFEAILVLKLSAKMIYLQAIVNVQKMQKWKAYEKK
jgi:hypothetical protein